MERDEYDVMYEVEDHHWWYLGMSAITRALLDQLPRLPAGREVLDAGCGTGAVLGMLSDYGRATGIDLSEHALHFSSKRGAERLARASVCELPFRDESFDLVTSFDVLCSCAPGTDDHALREFARVLRPGGHVLLRLPAFAWLGGKHDEFTHIHHRYTAGELARQLAAAGFAVEKTSYANTFLFPLVALRRLSERIRPPRESGSDLTIATGATNGLLAALLSSEAPLVRSVGLPFGVTVVALGRKH